MALKKLLTIPILLLGLLVIFHLSRSIVSLYGRGGRVGELVAEVAGLEEKKEELEREKSYRETEEFVEREARDKLRMTKEGEHILVLPGGQNEQIPNPKSQIPNLGREPHWRKWIDFWLGM